MLKFNSWGVDGDETNPSFFASCIYRKHNVRAPLADQLFAFDQTFLLSSLYAGAGWAAIYLGGKWYGTHLFLKENQLTRREFAYIKQNLQEAKAKIARLRKALFKVKNIQTIKQNLEILRIVRKIYTVTKTTQNAFIKQSVFIIKLLIRLWN